MKKTICLIAMLSTTSAMAGEKCPLSTAAANHQATVLVATAAQQDIVDTAAAAGQFNTLIAAVKAAGLVDTLKGDGPFTVFAPTDAAFAKLPKGTVETLLKPENKAKLQSILTFHVVPGKVMAADVSKLSGATTAQGQQVSVSTKNGKVMIDGANVVKADIAASNGVIHVIDQVLMPADKDIVATAAANKSFSTLVAAVKAAGLVETLQGEGPFTVFAPTDEAFAKLPEGTIATLLKPENKSKLVSILTYHVVPGKVMAADAAKLSSADTVNGEGLAIKTSGGKVMINDATVTAADVETTNGVIHVIDSVLMP
ncbi:fasciclin domain-containing protein [Stieleria sp. TO1_6]|nr:fasciclin domain-containing protein [Stieleria tagensis]MCO8122055.1 fasciclin domain-containing protein [Stieleria tagensis]